MAVTTTEVRSGPFTPNGATTDFPLTFHAMSEAEVRVYGVVGSAETEITSGYTITGLPGVGTLVFDEAPTTGLADTIWAESAPSFEQETVTSNQIGYNGDAHQEVFDKLAVQGQFLNDKADRIAETAAVDAAGMVTEEGLELIGQAVTDGQETITVAVTNAGTAVEGQRDSALAAVDAAGAAVADSLGILGGSLFDVIPASAGYDGGVVITDPNGWTHDDKWLDRDASEGDVVLLKRPNIDWSEEVDFYRIYIRPSWPSPNPTVFHTIASVDSSGGRHVANFFSATPPSDNLFNFDTGDIRSTTATGMTFTKQYAVGPSGVVPNSAVRGQHGTTSAAFSFLNDILPANGGVAWRLEVYVRGEAAGVTNVQRGAATALTADTVTDSAWKMLPRDPAGIVSDGVTAINYQVRGSGANTPTLQYDRLQGYPTGSFVNWADEPPKNHHIKRRLSTPGSITADGNGEVIMTGGVNFAHQSFPGHPDVTTVTDVAVSQMVDVTAGAANTRFISTEATVLATDPNINPITTASTWYTGTSDANGQLASAPVNPGAAGANVPLKDAGPIIIQKVDRSGFRGILIDGMILNLVNTNHTSFKARSINHWGTSQGAGAPSGSWIGDAQRWGQAPGMSVLVGDAIKLMDEFSEAWARGGTRNKLYYSGDSLAAAGFGAGNAGALFSQGDYGYHTRPLPTANRALSGSTYARMRARWNLAASDIGLAATWPVSDRDAMDYSVQCGNNQLFAANVSFPNDLTRFATATVQSLVDDYLDWAEDVKAVTGNPLILWGPCDVQTATTDQHDGRDLLETALIAASDPGGDLLYISNQGQPYYTWHADHYYDTMHMRYDTVGVGHHLAKEVVHDELDGSGLILA